MPAAHPNLARLASRVRGEVRLGRHDRMLYATDASIYQVEPAGVVIPADREDAAGAVRACWALGLPVLPRGGGTSLAGQCVSDAVVLDLSAHLRGISGLGEHAGECRAEAGATIGEINRAAAPHGLVFAPDPATAEHATIGGCIGNNAAGARSIRYGRTSESVLGVRGCLADGRPFAFGEPDTPVDGPERGIAARVAEVCQRHERLIRERFPTTRRRNAGYALDMILAQLDGGTPPEEVDLTPLLCGAEGTLAVVLDARLRLHPIPRATGLAVVSFTGVDEAIAAVPPILALGPSAVELLDAMIIRLARDNIEQRRHTERLPGGADAEAVLYVEFQSAEEDAAADVRAWLEKVAGMVPADRVALHTDPAAMAGAWALRKAGEPLLHGIPGDRKPVGFIEDAAVPPARLGEYVRRLRGIVGREGTVASYYAHASVGVLHVRPLLDLRDANDREAMERIAVASADLAKELGGVMSGEHGDGRARGPLLERFYGPELMAAFREVKAIFDPENRLNPGNIVEPGPIASIHERTRVGAERVHPIGGAGHKGVSARGEPWAPITGADGDDKDAPRARARGSQDPRADFVETYFDFSDQGGLAHAAALCNGAGVCRKTSGGAMCPSYRGTLDERHATRGRGNALRLAITGQLGDGAEPRWDDPETLATLDLCLSCKACKSECPSNVDVAKLKAEYLAQRHAASGRVPLADRVFGNIHTLNRLAGLAPGLANLGMTLTRPLANAILGIHPRRSLPRYEKPLHSRWMTARSRSRLLPSANGAEVDAPSVLLYADTFTTYNEPDLGLAARRVLEAFGYRVELFRGSDAARALISVGLLHKAIDRADAETRKLTPRLTDTDDPAHAVLFLEPSCLSAVRDDWLSLRCETPEPDRRALADRSFLVEQFLADRWDAHPRNPFSTPVGAPLRTVAGGPRRGSEGGLESPRLPGEILLHAHCHQKALWGAGSSVDLLQRCFPGRVRVLDTTCCGLAGSFGYSAPRFGLSMRIGGLDVSGVLPAARLMKEGNVLVAPGTSCRHQIRDGSGVRAVHPVEVIDAHLSDESRPRHR